MAADPNTDLHQRTAPSSFFDRRMVSFQSGGVGSSARMIPTGMDGFVGVTSSSGMLFTGNPAVVNDTAMMIPGRNISSGLLLDPMMAPQDSAGLAVDWSLDEQALLEQGLAMYANEPGIMKYVKVAATLKNKTIRDVALRWRWMTKKEAGKRRKQEEYFTGKKAKDKKDKQRDFSPRTSAISCHPPNPAACSPIMYCMDSKEVISHEAPLVDILTRCLLEDNERLLGQIRDNLNASKLQENINIFFHVKNNITSILTRTSELPGKMSRMSPLPVSIDEELVSSLIPRVSEALLFGDIHMKHEPGCG